MSEANTFKPFSLQIKSPAQAGFDLRGEMTEQGSKSRGALAGRDLRILRSPFRRGQAIKSARGMPWHQEPMKDVISCEKLRGAANEL